MKDIYRELRHTIANSQTVYYPKKAKSEVVPLSENYVNLMVNKVCTQQIENSKPLEEGETPVAEVVLGYPGAGKSNVERALLKKYNGNLVGADFDEFRPYDKRVLEAIKENPLVADYYCQLPLALRDNMLYRTADARRHIMISTPCIDINEHPKNSLEAVFGKKGYHLNITYVAANKHMCCLSNITRYFQARRHNLEHPEEEPIIPRLVAFQDHDFLCGETMKKINFVVDGISHGSPITMKVVDRNNKFLCDETNYQQIPHVIKAKERQPLSPYEEKRLAYELNYINESIQILGLSKQEKRILSNFFNGRLINHQNIAYSNHHGGR